jgi:hypothetical protein
MHRRSWRALLVVLAGSSTFLASTARAAEVAPQATLRAEVEAPTGSNQGVARTTHGWIFSGTNSISRTNERLKVVAIDARPIPIELKLKGYNHVGDGDAVGKVFYAPLEQSDYERGDQVMARYDSRSLALIDVVPVAQHENSFVTVDPKTMIAYSLDRFGGDALLRYDVRHAWTPLTPLPMSRFVDKVQGADVADGFVWLSTADDTNELFRVDLASGQVDDLGSAGHVGGEGEGIDATPRKSGLLHVLTIDPTRTPVWFGHFAVS